MVRRNRVRQDNSLTCEVGRPGKDIGKGQMAQQATFTIGVKGGKHGHGSAGISGGFELSDILCFEADSDRSYICNRYRVGWRSGRFGRAARHRPHTCGTGASSLNKFWTGQSSGIFKFIVLAWHSHKYRKMRMALPRIPYTLQAQLILANGL